MDTNENKEEVLEDISEKENNETIEEEIKPDKKIDEEDALLILKHDSGISSLTKEQEKRADLNNDGDVDASDAVIILRIINNNK